MRAIIVTLLLATPALATATTPLQPIAEPHEEIQVPQLAPWLVSLHASFSRFTDRGIAWSFTPPTRQVPVSNGFQRVPIER